MRFHIGFSKFISIKTFISILGFLFIGLLAFFGLTDHAFAWINLNWTVASGYGADYHSANGGQYYEETVGFDTTEGVGFKALSDGLAMNYYGSVSGTNYASSQFYMNTSTYISNGQRFVTEEARFTIVPEDDCSSSGNAQKSIDFKFTIQFQCGYSNCFSSDYLSNWNLTDNNQFVRVYMGSYNSLTDEVYYNLCTITSTNYLQMNYNGLSKLLYGVTCTNVFSGNDNVSISNYRIKIVNNLGRLNRYSSSNIKPLQMTNFSLVNSTDLQSYYLQYQCSDEAPESEVEIPSGDEPEPESTNPNNIFCELLGNCDDMEGGEVTPYIPSMNTLTSVVTAPIRLLNYVVDHADSCSPVEVPMVLSHNSHLYVNDNVVIPCGSFLWSHVPDSVELLYHTLIFGLLAYRLVLDVVKFINNQLNPEYSKEYFMEL